MAKKIKEETIENDVLQAFEEVSKPVEEKRYTKRAFLRDKKYRNYQVKIEAWLESHIRYTIAEVEEIIGYKEEK